MSTLLPRRSVRIAALSLGLAVGMGAGGATQQKPARFHLEEATIGHIQESLLARRITTVGLVELYLKRIKAYNGTCVNEPQGRLGPITTIPRAGQINALSTLNLRPAARVSRGFDDRKVRSITDRSDDGINMPDALEVAATQDRRLTQTGRLAGPLH